MLSIASYQYNQLIFLMPNNIKYYHLTIVQLEISIVKYATDVSMAKA